ncbi:hypothetical protein Kole_0942 [Kosmotoga olearia TBF 19.5.1]|uniref:Uncharacterized protein n=1 Tax=Kosmotoga olearia (strain ATCC BAA-1733 / DSM 21960 / TBF 19.5.1) TaxID=521045 RepID=C5CGY6_KOSOT|nr:hypothetical protein Kole_0942 [Kosmotoga olearia TBF 19.5.1]
MSKERRIHYKEIEKKLEEIKVDILSQTYFQY